MTPTQCFIGVDVGGTFTDFVLSVPGTNTLLVHKQPSTPQAPDKAIAAGVAWLLERTGLAPSSVARLAHGTTVGTNALIERKVGNVALVTTEGFRDLLEIGRQTRPKMYDEHLDRPRPLVPRHRRFEVRERMLADGAVHKPLDEDALRSLVPAIVRAEVDCVVVGFLHSYAYPEHERRAAVILEEMLPTAIQVLTSASVYPEYREYERLSTTVLNGALMTVMNVYLDRISADLKAQGISSQLKVSHSAGGLMSGQTARRLPIRASLSGPAAGVLGAQRRARVGKIDNLITLDVGGTSADVSLLHGARAIEVYDRELAGFPLRLPAFDVNAVGAGGGSVAWIGRDRLLKVGPHSAGAHPGPTCYALGGTEPTVTDANVVLGRVNPTSLLDGTMPIDHLLAERAISRLAERLGLGTIETALGIVKVACATIVKAIRNVSVERGYDPGEFALFAIGGAGPLHGPDVARELGITRMIVPPSPGILCAEGLLGSDLRSDFVSTVLIGLDDKSLPAIESARDTLRARAQTWFETEQVPAPNRNTEWKLDMRYFGQNYELSVPIADEPIDERGCLELVERFHLAHEAAYGFSSAREPIEVVNVKARTVGVLDKPGLSLLDNNVTGRPTGTRPVRFHQNQWHESPIWHRSTLGPGQRLEGPVIIEQLDATTPVFPGDICRVQSDGSLHIELSTT